ncbi:MAG: aminotransferase class V-fold PLP-dependent enzyme [Opitutaceae bacterium]
MKRRKFLGVLATGGVGMAMASEVRLGAPSLPAGAPMGDGLSWSEIRSLFPLREDRVYLNTGGLGPAPQAVLDALKEQSWKQAWEGEHGHGLMHECREETARFFGVDPEEVCFTRNATESNSIIAAGLKLEAGDEVIFESHAHPGGSFPWMNRQMLDGVRVRIFDPDPESPEGNLERILALVNEKTRVIQVSHLTAPTGLLFDVPAIAREARKRGIWFHVDGAQSAGMIPVDLRALECDSYATSGHKWLNGPQGTGILYIARPVIDRVRCSHIGAYSSDKYELPDTFSYNPTVARHEYGTRDAASVLGLVTALRMQDAIGRDRIASHGRQLAGMARTGLSGVGGLEILTPERADMHASIMTFRVPDLDCQSIASHLTADHGFRCRVVTERNLNAVRTSWHLYNSEDQIGGLVAAVSATVADLRKG